jgi:hypothetical protein
MLRWFDITAFTTPRAFLFGNAGRNVLEGPVTRMIDLSTFKRFPFREERSAPPRIPEIFNLPNTPQFIHRTPA